MTHSGFFAVGRETFVRACGLGLNAAAAFLVLARGSAHDNVTTRWSAESVGDRLGVRWTTAKSAITSLTQSRLASREKGSSRPSYTLSKKGDLIWLPNTLVDGAGEEVPPVAKVRQTQDVMALRLFIELYSEQNLREDGGISKSITWWAYDRERVGQRGPWVVWRFFGPSHWMGWSTPTTRIHRRNDLSEAERAAGKNEAVDFFRRFALLVSLGLIEVVPYLYEGPEGEPIHPLHWDSTIDAEAQVYRACDSAARACLTEAQEERATDKGGVLAAVPAHIAEVQLFSIGRLRYRPHTRLTAAWWAESESALREYARRYESVAGAVHGTGEGVSAA